MKPGEQSGTQFVEAKRLTRRGAVLALLVVVMLAGCAPAGLQRIPPDWPHDVEGRALYVTPRAFIYATSPAAAGWMDRYLNQRVPQIEKRFGVSLGRGVVIVVSPGDRPMRAVNQWPSYEEALALSPFGAVDLKALGLPAPSPSTYRWACALAADAFYNEAMTEQFRRSDRRFWSQPHALLKFLQAAPGFLFGRPYIRQGHMATCDAQREQALALTAIARSDIPEDRKKAVLARVEDYYAERGAQRQAADQALFGD